MKSPSPTVWNADRLDVQAFAQAGASLQAEEPLTCFERLSQALTLQPSAQEGSVTWRAVGQLRPVAPGGEPEVWLHLLARTTVPLSCQRCLEVVEQALEVDRWFRFVADESMAALEDEDSDEDVLALEPRPSLRELLEDELLMALPMVPMHAICPEPVVMRAGSGEQAQAAADPQPRKNPFAALAKLKS